jgi:hypothetical protein
MTHTYKRLVLGGVLLGLLLACGCSDKEQGPRIGSTAGAPQPFRLPSNKTEGFQPGPSKHLTPPGQ